VFAATESKEKKNSSDNSHDTAGSAVREEFYFVGQMMCLAAELL
jgi:hypothetical protein